MSAPVDGEGRSDSPVGWIADHIQRYVDSDGADGHDWRGRPALLLTTRGRKSGTARRTALFYGRDGDSMIVVASNGGSAKPPLWYLNLVADPTVRLQVGAEVFTATARTADASEKARLWPIMTAIFPTYDEYAVTAGRDIPVVILSPTAG